MEQIEGSVRISAQELQAIIDNGKYRSREEIDSVYKLMDIIKDAHCIWQYEDEESDSVESRLWAHKNLYRFRLLAASAVCAMICGASAWLT